MDDDPLSRVPRGEMSWARLLEYVRATDDRIERHYLEVKSDVELDSKAGRVKVAKFVLGSANRDPEVAARYLEGFAVMLLGVGDHTLPGVARFEAHELTREVTRLVGVDGPRWDYRRLHSDSDNRDVVAVVVDPPTGKLWPCRADGAGVKDADIFLRADGETRHATGDEIHSMLARATAGSPARVDLAVTAHGGVQLIPISDITMFQLIEDETKRLLDSVTTHSPGVRVVTSTNYPTRDRRSPGQFRREVDTWAADAKRDPTRGLRNVAAHRCGGASFAITNRTRRYLPNVRLTLQFPEPVRAVEWHSSDEADDSSLIFPGRPLGWGRDLPERELLPFRSSIQATTHNQDRIIRIEDEYPARLSVSFEDLRSLGAVTSDDDDVVLVLTGASDVGAEIAVGWTVTAADVHEVFEGEFQMPVMEPPLGLPGLRDT